MIIDNNGNDFNDLTNKESQMPKKLHSNQGTITPENNLLTRNIHSFSNTDPTNSKDMSDKAVALLHERYKNNLINKEDFNKHCNDIGKNRQ